MLGRQGHLAQHFADAFWRRWLQEYFPTLLPRKKGFNSEGELLRVGDLVLIMDRNSPRNEWRKVVVTRTFPDVEGIVRNVELRVAGGFLRKPTFLERPVHKLVRFSLVQNA